MRRLTSAVALATAVCLAAPAAWASTVIHVEETGEGGGPMAIKLDASSAKAGEVVFDVTNAAMTEQHEFVVVKLKSKDQKIPLDAAKHRIDESKLKSMGEVSDLKPSGTGQLKAKLKPGEYLLFCNLKGHYEAGMATHFTVTN